MRYLIETVDKEMVIGAKIAEWHKKKLINIIEKGDPIDEIKTQLLKISRAFEILRKVGIDEEILITYIRSKGVPKSTIEAVLYHQKEFFEKLGLKT